MGKKIFDGKPIYLVQILKYYSIGAFINIAGYCLFLLFIKSGIEYRVAASILYVTGVIASFLLNRKLVFESKVTLKSSLIKSLWVIFPAS